MILRPISDGTYSQFTPYPASPATLYDKVNEETTDDDSSYITAGTGSELYATFSKTSISAGSPESVTVKARGKGIGGNALESALCLIIGGTTYYWTEPLTTSYSVIQKTWSTNPATGSAWTLSDFNNIEFGVMQGAGSAYPIQVTQVWIEITTINVDVADTGSGADSLSLAASLTAGDVGSGADTASVLATLATIADGHEHTQPMALGMGYVFDPSVDSGYGVDSASIVASLIASDTGSGLDAILPIGAAISTSDTGHGVDIGSVAKAFFLIDSHNILQPLGVFVMRDGKEELLPTTRNNTDTVPGRNGEFDFGSELEARVMEFKVHINTTPETKTALKRTLAAYLNPLLGVKPLIDSHDLEKTYYVKYAGNIDLSNYVNALQFTIPFKASDPIIYGSYEQTQVGSGTITNDGTLECPLTVTITGAVTNPSVVIGSYTLTYTGTLTSSDTLIIDTGALTCTFNGVNALGDLTGLTPDVVLAVGDTVVTVPASGTTTITYTERWI